MLIPDAGVGVYNAIPNDLQVIRSNFNQSWIVAGDSLYSSDLLKPDKGLSLKEIQRLVFAIAWHPINDINSRFVHQAQTLWKIDPTDITWRTATSYDAVLVLSKALTPNSTRIGIQKTLAMAQFSVKGATGVIQFQGGDRQNGTIALVTVRPNCNSSGFVLTTSDRPDFSPHVARNLNPQPPSLVGKGEISKPLFLQEKGFPDPVKSQSDRPLLCKEKFTNK